MLPHAPFPIQIHVAMQVVTESTYTSLSEYIFLRHEVKYVSYSLPEEVGKLKTQPAILFPSRSSIEKLERLIVQ